MLRHSDNKIYFEDHQQWFGAIKKRATTFRYRMAIARFLGSIVLLYYDFLCFNIAYVINGKPWQEFKMVWFWNKKTDKFIFSAMGHMPPLTKFENLNTLRLTMFIYGVQGFIPLIVLFLPIHVMWGLLKAYMGFCVGIHLASNLLFSLTCLIMAFKKTIDIEKSSMLIKNDWDKSIKNNY